MSIRLRLCARIARVRTLELRQNTLLRNALWVLGGSGIRLVLQAVYFLLIARALGAGQYGAFIGAVALVALVAPFSSWGTGFILIKNVARDRATFGQYWGTAFSLTAFTGILLVGLVLLVSHTVWRGSVPFEVLLFVGISDVILVRLVDLSAQAFTAVEVLRRNSELYIVLSGTRTLAAVVLAMAVHSPTATSWALLYLLSALCATIYSIVIVIRVFGLVQLKLRLSLAEFREGFYFAVSQASQTIYNDIDKTMLVRFGGLEATGLYGAAYRIVDVSFAPIGALVSAAFPRFFQHGQNGISGSTRFARRLIAYSAGYGFMAAAALYASSPILPILLGKGFASAASVLRWLSPLVFIKSIHYFLADSLSGAGFQGIRASIQLGVVVINVVLNLWLIPTYSWKGAAWASLATDSALLVSLVAASALVPRKQTLECATGAESRMAT